ncbi:MAG: hypothetical protein CENE_01070 [Candidatus Celerinatantimonas neptuna]|nr:MAG: hypothetical protein CENE_01070 [Candidatus Celerinatantimonas neptuna]
MFIHDLTTIVFFQLVFFSSVIFVSLYLSVYP